MLNPYEHAEAERLAAVVADTAALEMMERNLSAELCRASECPLG
jgi:hypothetical protein